jgi:hypothetical protein
MPPSPPSETPSYSRAAVLAPFLVTALLFSLYQISLDLNDESFSPERKLIRNERLEFGLTSGDRFLGFAGYGRLSNNLVMLSFAIDLARRTGRKLLTYPPTAQLGGTFFSASWLQILDLDQINRMLDPTAGACRIRGWKIMGRGRRKSGIIS